MDRAAFYFYIGLATAGTVVAAFVIRQTYVILRIGVIERRAGLQPLTPNNRAVLYWFAVVISIAGAFLILFGVIASILRALSS